MSQYHLECHHESLQLLLKDQLHDHDRDTLLEHLESCDRCQQQLSDLVASRDEWKRVSKVMSQCFDEPDDVRSFTVPPLSPQPIAWSESMAMQLLLPASHPEMLGRLGRYDVERLIGSGGMGVVFKAYDRELNRPVAIKIMAPYLASSGPARKRFSREARAAAAVVHPHVVPIHNVETDREAPFIVMQFVSGESLQNRINREGPLELCEILRIGMQVADGLAAAHQQGLVHRDIKPSNILLEEDVDRAMISDFGLARAVDDASLTRTGFHAGTPQYMSPEQAAGDTVDARSDLFSLGSMLYTLCTGHPPFRADHSLGVMRKITDSNPKPIHEFNPAVPVWLCSIISRLMAKPKEERFQSADEVYTLLESCLCHAQQPQSFPLPGVPGELVVKDSVSTVGFYKRMLLVMVASTFLIVCVSLLAALPLNQQDEPASSKPASQETANNQRKGPGEMLTGPETPSFLTAGKPQDSPENAVDQMALETIKAKHAEVTLAYSQACSAAKDEGELNRVYEEMDPRNIMPPIYLALEESCRGTSVGLEALSIAANLASSGGGEKAAKGRAEAIDRITDHYMDQEGIKSVIEGLNGGFWPPRAQEFLEQAVDQSPFLEIRAEALLKLIMRDKMYLDLETRIPELRDELRKHDQELQSFFRVQVETMLKKLEETDFDLLRIRANQKLERLADLANTPVSTYGSAAVATECLSHAINKVVIGRLAPELVATDIYGEDFQLKQCHGKIVVLLFSYDSRYQEMYDSVRQLVARYEQFPVRVVGVMGTSDPANLKAACDTGVINWTVLQEPLNGPLYLKWGVDGYPSVYIIGADGRLHSKTFLPAYSAGGYDTMEVRTKIEELLTASRRY